MIWEGIPVYDGLGYNEIVDQYLYWDKDERCWIYTTVYREQGYAT